MRTLTIITAAVIGLGLSQPAGAAEKMNIAWGGSNPGGVMYYPTFPR